MSYFPRVGDKVRIRQYRGILHPMTIWEVTDTRPDLSHITPYVRKNDISTNDFDRWIENDKLTLIHVPNPSANNDPDIAGA